MTASKQEPTYPVTETELRQIQNDCKYPDRTDCDYCSEVNADTGCSFSANILIEDILSRTPHSSQPVPDSTTLMQMAETEWHNREERFGLHDAISWTTGWMAGYLTPNKPDWSKEHDTATRKAERERVVDEAIGKLKEDIEYEEYCIKQFDTNINRIQKSVLCQVVDQLESLRQQEEQR